MKSCPLILLSCSIIQVTAFIGSNNWGIDPTIFNKNEPQLYLVPTSSIHPMTYSHLHQIGEKSSTAFHMAPRRGRPKGPLRTIEKKPPMNAEIEYDTLRVTTPASNGKGKDEMLGIMSKQEALAKAKEMGNLDVILINENSDPPVCKIADYSKYRYEKEKKAKATEVKEVKMSYKIDVHDYGVRKKSASKFLSQGNRVKCTVMFKGREIQHDKLGYELLQRMAEDLEDLCVMEGKPKREGRSLSCFITPKPSVVKAINDKKRADEKAQRKKKEASRVKMEEEKAAKIQTKEQGDASVTATAAAAATAELSIHELLKVGYDDDDDDDSTSLDELLGGDGVTDDLFA